LIGLSCEKDKKAWRDWLENEKTNLKPQPYTEVTDQVNENEVITRRIFS
jgi:hypothetical protein